MTQRDLERARMLGQSAGRNGAGPNANPWRSSPTLRNLADAWERSTADLRGGSG